MPWTCRICFPTWAAVLADGEELPEGRVLNDERPALPGGAGGDTQAYQAPPTTRDAGRLRPSDREHAGRRTTPSPGCTAWIAMRASSYRYNGKVYQVAEGGDTIPCTWPPTPPACGSGRKCRHKMKGGGFAASTEPGERKDERPWSERTEGNSNAGTAGY